MHVHYYYVFANCIVVVLYCITYIFIYICYYASLYNLNNNYMKSTKVQNPWRIKCSAVVVAEYRIPYRIGPRTIITHAHCAPLIDGLGHATRSATKGSTYLSHRLASCAIVSVFRAALDLYTYPLSNFICPRCAKRPKPGRGNQCSSSTRVYVSFNYIGHTGW